jgi:hypothetical protein
MALESTQPLSEMGDGNLPAGIGVTGTFKTDVTAICELTV